MTAPLTHDLDTRRLVGPVTRTDFVRYAGAGGDFNPLHHDDDYAKALGMPSVIAMGMWTAGLLASFVSDHLGLASVGSMDLRFRSPVWPGDELTLSIGNPGDDGSRAIAVTADAKPRITGTVAPDLGRTGPHGRSTPAPDRHADIAATTFDDVEFRVERGKIVEFARAIRSTSALHYDVAEARAAGYPDLFAPVTFGNALAHWSGGDASAIPQRLGLQLSRVVHGEQRYRIGRAMVAGDVLTARRRVGAVGAKRARGGGDMTLVTVVTEFSDEHGALVLAEEMVMIEQPATSTVVTVDRRDIEETGT